MADGAPRRPDALARALVALAAALLLGGCAQVRSHLPSRGAARTPPPATVPAKPRPPVASAESEPAKAGGFVVLAAGAVERDRTRARQALATSDPDALPAQDAGYYVDVLQGRLRQVVGPRVQVTRHGSRIALDLSRAIGFAPGGRQLGPGAADVLAPIAQLLAQYRQVLATVRVSPVDATANDDPELAQARAVGIAQQLADAGVARRHVLVVGPGGPGARAGARVVVELEPIVRAAVKP